MNEAQRTSVLIVGAGPAGMVMAACLDHLGVDCLVVERRPALSTHPKAHELSSRSLEILTSLGVPFASLDAHASSHADASKIVFGTTAAHDFARIDLRDDDAGYRAHTRTPKPYLNVSQTAVEAAVLEHLGRCAHVAVKFATAWVASEETTDGVRSQLRDESTGATTTVTSRYVIAADGASSRVRKALGIPMDGPDTLDDFVNVHFRADLSASLPSRAKLYFLFDPRCAGTLVAHDVASSWVYHTPIVGLGSGTEDYTERELRARLAVAIGSSAASAKFESIERWRMSAQVASRFREGRAFLIGDAAHRFPPTGGLGMNTGIADAHNLAWKLALVASGRAEDALLDTYERERRPVAIRNCQASRVNYGRLDEIIEALGVQRTMAMAALRLRVRLLRWLPRALVNALFALALWPVRAWLAYVMRSESRIARLRTVVGGQLEHFDRLGIDLGVTYGTASDVATEEAELCADDIRRYAPSTSAGARLPHAWLDARHTRSTHDLLDSRGFTVLLGQDSTLDTAAFRARLPSGLSHSIVRLTRTLGDDMKQHVGVGAAGALVVRPDGHVTIRDPMGALSAHELAERLVAAHSLGRAGATSRFTSSHAPVAAEAIA